MAGQATAAPVCRPHGKRSAQARIWEPGRRRQPNGVRERWKPELGRNPAGGSMRSTTARPAVPPWPGTPRYRSPLELGRYLRVGPAMMAGVPTSPAWFYTL